MPTLTPLCTFRWRSARCVRLQGHEKTAAPHMVLAKDGRYYNIVNGKPVRTAR